LSQVSRTKIIERLGTLVAQTPTYWFAILFPALLFAHNPHAILHAEFWGEDGIVWYSQARDMGLASLLEPNGGYLNSLQRLVAIAAQPFPLAWGPTLFALFALCMQSAPAVFLMSKRMVTAWPDGLPRFMFALLFILMPNAPETSLNVTNSQWYLAILMFLVLVSDTPKKRYLQIFDSLVLIVSGLSGPFGVLFFPVAAIRTLTSRLDERPNRIWRSMVLGAASSVQLLLILGISHAGRKTGPLGASTALLLKILSLVPMGAELGYRTVSSLLHNSFFFENIIPIIIVTLSFLIISFAFLRGPRILREFIFFSTAMFALALFKPLISLSLPQWPLILNPPAGNRYFLYPMIAWWGSLFVMASSEYRFARLSAVSLLTLTFFFAVPSDWGDLLKLSETDFVARAHQLDASQPGTIIKLPEHPTGMEMVVTQRREPVINSQEVIDSDLNELIKKPVGQCVVDTVNGAPKSTQLTFAPDKVISLVGWTVTSAKVAPKQAKIVLLNRSIHYAFKTSIGLFRPDVQAALNSAGAYKSGYSSAISLKSVPSGSYTMYMLLSTKEADQLCTLDLKLNVDSN